MNTNFPLYQNGFISHYLISGPARSAFCDPLPQKEPDKLKYEHYLRSILPKISSEEPVPELSFSQKSECGTPWEYYYSHGNCFVDVSNFYSTLYDIRFLAACEIISTCELDTTLQIWSYCAAGLWINGSYCGGISTPVYKPISQKTLSVHLKKGSNRFYIRLRNLGVRDTRNLFAMQFANPAHFSFLEQNVPEQEYFEPEIAARRWLSSIKVSSETLLHFPSPAPEDCFLKLSDPDMDLEHAAARDHFTPLHDQTNLSVGSNASLCLEIRLLHTTLTRCFEFPCNMHPHYTAALSERENFLRILHEIADISITDRFEDGVGFAMQNILARRALDIVLPKDSAYLLLTLQQIQDRFDCSDFLLCAYLRYLKNYSISDDLAARTRDVLINYRYWMDQDGTDAMCFWSENHQLMFYVCAMMAGERYPDEPFPNAHMTGKELRQHAISCIDLWLHDIETYGFEEFQSGTYINVTFAALLNVVDYAPENLQNRARKVTDTLLAGLVLHTFQGVLISPQGRVYRDAIYPFLHSAQSLINCIDCARPSVYGEGWISGLATSSYHFQPNLKEEINASKSICYSSGNARIHLEKTPDYVLTSVESPRTDPSFIRWNDSDPDGLENEALAHFQVKKMNERFHGTTCFAPGVYGYQQHLWHAALSPDCSVFINHPGEIHDGGSMRPGYWHGEGCMPALLQSRNMLGIIYHIPQELPVHFTHLLWMPCKFDRTLQKGHWMTGQKNGGYIGIWCSGQLEAHDDLLINAEMRCYDDKVAYLCICGDHTHFESLTEFMQTCEQLSPCFDPDKMQLTADSYSLTYHAVRDLTQYI